MVSRKTTLALSGLGERLIRGVGAGLVGQLLSVFSRILLPPMFLKSWGVDVYGEWLLITAVVANLALSEVGGGIYVTNRLTQFYANSELKLFRATLQTALVIFVTWPVAIFLMFLLVVALVPMGSILGLKTINGELLSIVAVVLAFQIIIEIPKGLILGVFRSTGNLSRGLMLTNYIVIMQMMFVVLGLWLGAGIVVIAVLQIIPIIIILLMAIFEINAKFSGQYLFSFKYFNLDIVKQFLRPSAYFFLIQISQVLSIQGVVLTIGLLLGSAQVVVFVTMRTLANVIKSIIGLVSHAAWPEMTKFEAEHDNLRLTMLFKALLRTTMVATIGIIFLLASFGGTVYEIWLGEFGLYDKMIMNLFLMMLALQVFWGIYGNLLMATNKHHGLSAVMLASAIVSILFAYVGANMDGIKGMLYGMIAAEVLLPLWMVPRLVYRHYGQFSLAMFFMEAAPLILLIPLILKPASALLFIPLLIMWWWHAVKPLRQGKAIAMSES